MIATHIRIRYKTLGGHVHARVFTGVPGFTFASCGELTFSVEEWPVMRELFMRAGERISFLEGDAS